MRLQIIGCDSGMWYSELIGEELVFVGETEDVYWAREPGHPNARNVVLKADAILVD